MLCRRCGNQETGSICYHCGFPVEQIPEVVKAKEILSGGSIRLPEKIEKIEQRLEKIEKAISSLEVAFSKWQKDADDSYIEKAVASEDDIPF